MRSYEFFLNYGGKNSEEVIREWRKKLAVVDASVVIKWFANENYSRESLILKEAYVKGLEDLSAPCILPFEVLNGLKYTYNLGEKELEEEDLHFIIHIKDFK